MRGEGWGLRGWGRGSGLRGREWEVGGEGYRR